VSDNNSILLAGIDGSNPLAFLAAIGTLRVASLALPKEVIRMSWEPYAGAWRPRLFGTPSLSAESIVDLLSTSLLEGSPTARTEITLGKNLTMTPDVLRTAALHCQTEAFDRNRRSADFISSFGCEIFSREVLGARRVSTTEFYFIFGSGHQHFLETAAKLLTQTQPSQLKEALFGPWTYRDEKLSFRWDPSDAREHAYQWTSPGDETTVTVWGANVLAFEAIPLFPVMPVNNTTITTSFLRNRRSAAFTWPIWSCPLTLDVTRSLLASTHDLEAEQVHDLMSRGVVAIFQSVKRKIGEGANFKWAFTPAKAI
jgi:hypothetical protein